MRKEKQLVPYLRNCFSLVKVHNVMLVPIKNVRSVCAALIILFNKFQIEKNGLAKLLGGLAPRSSVKFTAFATPLMVPQY